ncbi:enoyl-CoA hydratase/isomerase family protein [Alterisphingorhabdus coralli]|uniref:Enoyl-CoA hydratase/isomerase family protein n=1 Tax=Alterisphingorhabdus coralli TaxID=3071408 RepID=A0AA97F7H0_9SPHN|nr:enoyl-CoA hydratase/isomerase family protein [Parasphingorhabdus sp. SCSIO 66989]WOE75388.1 enoyl-CoA hydratase/isomerase family protein [Parasphingorhabdus sp. SCSIO 66989]
MTLRLEKTGRVAHLVIDRADKRNAFTQEMWEMLPGLLDQAMQDDDVRCMMLRASARDSAFCAGADIKEFATGARDADWRARNQAAINRVQHELARAAKPTIAVIDGDCVGGGCGLSLACDFRVAGPKARFGITPSKLGLVYPLHDTKLLVDLVGPSQAKRMLFTGQLLSAKEALSIGLITMLEDDPHQAADQLAQTLTETSLHSQTMSKAIIGKVLDGQVDDDDETRRLFDQAFWGTDFDEGVSAFLEKRKPQFK